MIALVDLYADLVMSGLRALEANDEGIPLVPAIYRAKVKKEVERRKASGEVKTEN